MATYTIKVNENTNAGKSLMAYLNSLGVVINEKVKKNKANYTALDQSEDDIKNGRIHTYESVDDFFEKMGLKCTK